MKNKASWPQHSQKGQSSCHQQGIPWQLYSLLCRSSLNQILLPSKRILPRQYMKIEMFFHKNMCDMQDALRCARKLLTRIKMIKKEKKIFVAQIKMHTSSHRQSSIPRGFNGTMNMEGKQVLLISMNISFFLEIVNEHILLSCCFNGSDHRIPGNPSCWH